MSEPQRGRFIPRNVKITAVHGDLSQEVIQITVDKMSLILYKHVSDLGRQKEWIAPTGVLVTIAGTFATATFKKWFFSADTWQAIYVVAGVIAFGWLFYALYRLRKVETIEMLVERIKKQE